MLNCNGYVKQSERVNEKNEMYCNGRMHAALNKSPATMCLKEKEKKKKTYRRLPFKTS